MRTKKEQKHKGEIVIVDLYSRRGGKASNYERAFRRLILALKAGSIRAKRVMETAAGRVLVTSAKKQNSQGREAECERNTRATPLSADR